MFIYNKGKWPVFERTMKSSQCPRQSVFKRWQIYIPVKTYKNWFFSYFLCNINLVWANTFVHLTICLFFKIAEPIHTKLRKMVPQNQTLVIFNLVPKHLPPNLVSPTSKCLGFSYVNPYLCFTIFCLSNYFLLINMFCAVKGTIVYSEFIASHKPHFIVVLEMTHYKRWIDLNKICWFVAIANLLFQFFHKHPLSSIYVSWNFISF